MTPEWSDLGLPAHIPHCKLHVLVPSKTEEREAEVLLFYMFCFVFFGAGAFAFAFAFVWEMEVERTGQEGGGKYDTWYARLMEHMAPCLSFVHHAQDFGRKKENQQRWFVGRTSKDWKGQKRVGGCWWLGLLAWWFGCQEGKTYVTVSTLKPMVGMVVTISPSFSLYSTVVFPAASNPTC